MRVELIPPPMPPPRTWTPTAVPPASRISLSRSPKWPAALCPKRKFSPTTTTPAPPSPISTSLTNSFGVFLDRATSNGTTHTSSAPYLSSISLRNPKGVSSFGGSPRPSTVRGWGWKVAATTLMPLLRPSSTARLKTSWWPRCTPSKFPRAITTGRIAPPRPAPPPRHPCTRPTTLPHTSPGNCHRSNPSLCARRGIPHLGPSPPKPPPQAGARSHRAVVLCGYVGCSGRSWGRLALSDAEVSDARAAQGGEVGARAEGSGEVVYEGSNVGAAAAGDLELCRLAVSGRGRRVRSYVS